MAGPTGIVLAGGEGLRLGGRNKALLELGGRTVLARLLDALRPLCGEVLLVTKDAGPFAAWVERVRLVLDGGTEAGAAVGLRAGLAAAPEGYCLAVAGDMPFVDRDVLARLLAAAAGRDAAALRWNGQPEPLLAAYHSRCLAPLQEQLAAGDRALHHLLARVDAAYLDWPGDARPLAAFNINNGDDLARARKLAARKP